MHLSPAQYGALGYFVRHDDVTVDDLRWINNLTIRSLLRRKMITRRGSKVGITGKGLEARDIYRLARVPERSHEGPLSPMVERLLNRARLSLITDIRRKINVA